MKQVNTPLLRPNSVHKHANLNTLSAHIKAKQILYFSLNDKLYCNYIGYSTPNCHQISLCVSTGYTVGDTNELGLETTPTS